MLRGVPLQAHELAEQDMLEYGQLSAGSPPSETQAVEGAAIQTRDQVASLHADACQQVCQTDRCQPDNAS